MIASAQIFWSARLFKSIGGYVTNTIEATLNVVGILKRSVSLPTAPPTSLGVYKPVSCAQREKIEIVFVRTHALIPSTSARGRPTYFSC